MSTLRCSETKHEKRGDKGFNLAKGMTNDIMRMLQTTKKLVMVWGKGGCSVGGEKIECLSNAKNLWVVALLWNWLINKE